MFAVFMEKFECDFESFKIPIFTLGCQNKGDNSSYFFGACLEFTLC